MSISATTWALPGTPLAPPTEPVYVLIGDAHCSSATAVLCAIVGGAILRLPRSLKSGMCCCCRDDHFDGCMDG